MSVSLIAATLIVIAFTGAGVLQVIWLKSAWASRCAVAIDCGLTLRGHRIFGANKTWRGFIGMVPATTLAFATLGAVTAACGGGPFRALGWSTDVGAWAMLGAAAGLGYMIGELPNSFLKRQYGIPPGGAALRQSARRWQFLIDQTDSVIGAALAIAYLRPLPWPAAATLIVLGPCVHQAFNHVLVAVGLKTRAA